MSKPGQAAGLLGRGGGSLGARFVLFAAVALALMVVDHRQDHLRRVRELLGVAVYPIQAAVDLPFSAWESLTDSMADRRSLNVENARLERELRLARVRLQSLQELERENDRLRELVNALEQQRELEIRMAEILNVDFENRQRFMINRGSRDGVFVGQPLLDAEGVVGQVMSVSSMSSEALLITDASHRLQVAVARTGQRAIAQGTGDSRLLRLISVTNSDDVVEGDVLVTTGMGGVFPRGRPVARVTQVQRQPGQNWASVLAEPVSRLDRDQEVLLVWDDRHAIVEDDTASLSEPVE